MQTPSDGLSIQKPYKLRHVSLTFPCVALQVQMQIEAHFISDVLRGHETTEMRVTLIRLIEDEMPPDDE